MIHKTNNTYAKYIKKHPNFTGILMDKYETKFWFKRGKLHREDGPAVEHANGSKRWYKNGKCHRDDGPAIESVNGDKEWYQNGKLHREDGTAVVWHSGYKEYWIEGVSYSEDEFIAYQRSLRLERFLNEGS